MKAIVNSTQQNSGNGGFTLLEVLIAMVIVSVGALGLAMMQGTTVQANSYSNQLTQATALGQSKIEELIVSNVSNLAVGSSSESNLKGNGDAGDGPFTRSWEVADNTDFSKSITVTVSWANAQIGDSSEPHSVQLSTITRGAGN